MKQTRCIDPPGSATGGRGLLARINNRCHGLPLWRELPGGFASGLKGAAALLGLLAVSPLMAQVQLANGIARVDALARADECYVSLGHNVTFSHPPCTPPAIPKVNEGYVWGMTATDTAVWFGTLANGNCITKGGLALALGLPTPSPIQAASYACEYGDSPYVPFGLPAPLGDFRPPRMYNYNIGTKELKDLTPTSTKNPFGIDPLVLATLGIRAAGSVGAVVIFAGPSLFPANSLNFFVFDTNTYKLLGEFNLPGYTDIRQFTLLNGTLYAAVGKPGGGAILKWTTLLSPFPYFTVVGTTDGSAAYIASHQGHLWVTTWPTGAPNVYASLYESPQVPGLGGLPSSSAPWTKIWSANDYEPDPGIALTYAGGALQSHGGYLYWGTIHVPLLSTAAALKEGAANNAQTLLNSMRTGVLFRIQGLSTTLSDVELLYGDATLPVVHSGGWVSAPNKQPLGRMNPTFGKAGFGNAFNGYIWSMTEWNSRLWIGTMDWSLPALQGGSAGEGVPGFTLPPSLLNSLGVNFGADLWSIGSAAAAATLESNNGLGNINNYGVRNMAPAINGNLFVGMANPANLLANPFPPNGGWELIEVQSKSSPPPYCAIPLLCLN